MINNVDFIERLVSREIAASVTGAIVKGSEDASFDSNLSGSRADKKGCSDRREVHVDWKRNALVREEIVCC